MDFERGPHIANSKSQINPDLKYPMTKTVLFGIWNFGAWNLVLIVSPFSLTVF
jgi:hypothetical protein